MILGHWTWLIIGLLLLILEMLAPGVFLLFIGVAAVLTGGIFMMFKANWEIQTLVFVFLALALVLLAWKFKFYSSKPNNINDRQSALIGQIYPLHTAIIAGAGMAKIGDSLWAVMGEDLPAGTQVRILAVRNNVLQVEAA